MAAPPRRDAPQRAWPARVGRMSGRLLLGVCLAVFALVASFGVSCCTRALSRIGLRPVQPAIRRDGATPRRLVLQSLLPASLLIPTQSADADAPPMLMPLATMDLSTTTIDPETNVVDLGQPFEFSHVVRPKKEDKKRPGYKAYSFDRPDYQPRKWRDASSYDERSEDLLYKIKLGLYKDPDAAVACGPPPDENYLESIKEASTNATNEIKIVYSGEDPAVKGADIAYDLEWITTEQGKRGKLYKAHWWARLLRQKGKKSQLLLFQVPENQHAAAISMWTVMRNSFRLDEGTKRGPII